MKKSYLKLNIELLQAKVSELPFHLYILNSKKTKLSLFILSFNPVSDIHLKKAEEMIQNGYILCIETNQRLVFNNFLHKNNITNMSSEYIQVEMNNLQIGEQIAFTELDNKTNKNRFASDSISTTLKADINEVEQITNVMINNIISTDKGEPTNLICEIEKSKTKDNNEEKDLENKTHKNRFSSDAISTTLKANINEAEDALGVMSNHILPTDQKITTKLIYESQNYKTEDKKSKNKNSKMNERNTSKNEVKTGPDLINHDEGKLEIISDPLISFLMSEVKKEVANFPQNHSHTVSLAKRLIDQYLNDQSLPNMLVLLSYSACKTNKKATIEDYADIICAAFLCQLGQTQLKHTIITSSYKSIAPDDQKLYNRYPGLTSHILKKTGIALSPRCAKIIEQHRERIDGSGFPFQKMESQIEPLAQVLGLSLQALEYSRGDINATSYDLFELLDKIKERKENSDFRLNFSEQALVSISQVKTMFEIHVEKNESQKLTAS